MFYSGNYASVATLIKKMYENDVDEIDKAHTSVLLECIEIRDRTSHCNSLSYEEANELIDWIAMMQSHIVILICLYCLL